MTKALERAFMEASKLPPPEQDAIADWLLHELEAETAWKQGFAGSSEKLRRLADEALAEHKRGQTQPLDPEGL
jgi:hypothetical protein